MNAASHFLRSSSQHKPASLAPRVLLLILALGVTCVSPAASARAAPRRAGSKTDYFFEILAPKDKICVKDKKSIIVNVKFDTDIVLKNGKAVHQDDGVANGVTVKASSSNPAVGHAHAT